MVHRKTKLLYINQIKSDVNYSSHSELKLSAQKWFLQKTVANKFINWGPSTQCSGKKEISVNVFTEIITEYRSMIMSGHVLTIIYHLMFWINKWKPHQNICIRHRNLMSYQYYSSLITCNIYNVLQLCFNDILCWKVWFAQFNYNNFNPFIFTELQN